ncbi:helix-turn-helix domain-containing protein [Aurantiacibacter luteus]|uniref:Transcriptional regulator n=1 Tax=Aurantiacibacter luteus TaxID=1581420 RepID=A0A0G9MNV3_9SPHN|nr:helix-turn-helix transcriptional regulator [Aurantiacibacter luteus]KLE32401.1 transcriptional regulator [Aurantiacibacter luteus]
MSRVSGKSDDTRLLERIGTRVRARRHELELSQEALADAAGIDRSHMGKIERGERNVTILNLAKIAAALDCDLANLVG